MLEMALWTSASVGTHTGCLDATCELDICKDTRSSLSAHALITPRRSGLLARRCRPSLRAATLPRPSLGLAHTLRDSRSPLDTPWSRPLRCLSSCPHRQSSAHTRTWSPRARPSHDLLLVRLPGFSAAGSKIPRTTMLNLSKSPYPASITARSLCSSTTG